jgi:hypothetical protein
MIRYVCDGCGVTSDEVLPADWSTAQIMVSTPPVGQGQGPSLLTVTKHACPLHDMAKEFSSGSGTTEGTT